MFGRLFNVVECIVILGAVALLLIDGRALHQRRQQTLTTLLEVDERTEEIMSNDGGCTGDGFPPLCCRAADRLDLAMHIIEERYSRSRFLDAWKRPFEASCAAPALLCLRSRGQDGVDDHGGEDDIQICRYELGDTDGQGDIDGQEANPLKWLTSLQRPATR